MFMRRRLLVFIVAAVLAVAGTVTVMSLASAADTPVTLMGAGDIVDSGDIMVNATATGDLIRAANPDFVFTAGDNAYPDGSASDYSSKYDPTWGSFKAKTRPTPGNHEYHANPPAGYLGYFGQSAVTQGNDPAQAWYAWEDRKSVV